MGSDSGGDFWLGSFNIVFIRVGRDCLVYLFYGKVWVGGEEEGSLVEEWEEGVDFSGEVEVYSWGFFKCFGDVG